LEGNNRGLIEELRGIWLEQRFSTLFDSLHTKQGAKIAKARHQFFKGEILSLK
jgi:hypothetical protein